MTTVKKAIDTEGIDEGTAQALASGTEASVRSRGIFHDELIEPVPEFKSSPSEKVISGKNNTWIVLGRDRPGNLTTGFGAVGHTDAGSIDFVVGRRFDKKDNSSPVDPNLALDAARVLIVSKTNVDDNFNLAAGSIGKIRKRSAAVLKADAVRVIARDGGIKLVTRTDFANSRGGEAKYIHGIDLMAGNDDKGLQPFVKGSNAVAALKELTDQVDSLAGLVNRLMDSQMIYNTALATHVHPTPTPAGSPPSIELGVASGAVKINEASLMTDMIKFKLGLIPFKQQFLSPVGSQYINSMYNNTN